MIIKVYINNHPFEIDCDTGTQDIAWLCLSACYLYGKEAWPVTTYLPIIARNKKDEILHPKLVICRNKELIGEEIKVRVKKKFGDIGYEMTNEEKEWYNDAFLEGRFMSNIHVSLKPTTELRKEQNQYKVSFKFTIQENIKLFFPNYGNEVICPMESKGKKGDHFEGNIKVPFGKLVHDKIIYGSAKEKVFDKETQDFIKNELTVTKSPLILTEDDKEKILREKEDIIREKEKKIKEDIINSEKEKKEEETRMIRLKEELEKIPFTLEEVYNYVKQQMYMSEQDLIEIFELLERNEYRIYRRIFEIFNSYCQFYLDNINLTVDALSVINFLNLYFGNRKNVDKISEEFQALYLSRLEKDGTEIDLREFIYILIFLLNSILTHKDINMLEEIESIGETYEKKLEEPAYYQMNKNKNIVKVLNDNYQILRTIFEKYGIHVEKSDVLEMSDYQFATFISELSNKFKYDLAKMTKGDVGKKSNIDFFDFFRKIVGMAYNLIQPNDNEENKDYRSDMFIGMPIEQAVEKIIFNMGDFATSG